MAGWGSLSTRQKVVVALGVSAGAAVLCVCYAKYRSGRGKGEERTQDAQTHCERQPEDGSDLLKCVTRSRGQVEAAEALIHQGTEESALRRAAGSCNFRAHRKEIIGVKRKEKQPSATSYTERSLESLHPAHSTEGRPADEATPINMADNAYSFCKFEVPSPDFNFRADEYVDVYVSASENPGHFWIQILGSRSLQLDKLTTEMKDFYSRQKPAQMAEEVQVGDIVAAQFRDDHFWYRAEVQGLLETGSVDLYYVDYGDNWACPRDRLFPLRSDFLSLPFQAVECGLANVAPNGETWSVEAMDTFDALSHCAKWRPLMAKIARFPSPGVSYFQVHLYDASRNPRLDIGQELIRRRFAVERRRSAVKSDDETLVSRLLEEVTGLSKTPDPTSFTGQKAADTRPESGGLLHSSDDDVIVVDDH